MGRRDNEADSTWLDGPWKSPVTVPFGHRGWVVTDPLTWATLGGTAATESIKFLFAQATEVLKAWRDRRQRNSDDALEVPVAETDVLDGVPVGVELDTGTIQLEEATLVRLIQDLAPYAVGLSDVDPGDASLATAVSRTRDILERAYGQRLTFRGEDRAETGSRLTVTQRISQASGEITGVDAESIGRAVDIAVDQAAGEVREDGSVTGLRIRRIG